MIFDIRFQVTNKQISFKANSYYLSFICDNKNLKNNFLSKLADLGADLNKLQLEEFIGKDCDELSLFNLSGKPDKIIYKKYKIDKKFDTDFFRNYFTGFIQSLAKKELQNIVIELPAFAEFENIFPSIKSFLNSIIEGVLLGNYTFDKYKEDKQKPKKLSVLIKIDGQVKENTRTINDAVKVIESVYFTRDLVNEPANALNPTEYERIAKDVLKSSGIKVSVLNKTQLQKKKMNAILAVGDASIHSPRLITMHYKPSGKSKRRIALVGKGVTYDAGGLSIKPTSGMLEMKADMAGSAVVLGVLKAAADLKLPVELFGYVPAVENMLSGSSYKPGDVITSYSGKTIEVKDTDAEGRIVLADALTFACEKKPDEIIDFATLTGAIVVALGLSTAGLFSQNKNLVDELLESSKNSDERLWNMPFDDSYNELIKSDIADVSNLGERWGGAITAGKFLEKFVDENIPWAHIDLAGPSIKHNAKNYTKKFDTGFGVRLMIDYLSRI